MTSAQGLTSVALCNTRPSVNFRYAPFATEVLRWCNMSRRGHKRSFGNRRRFDAGMRPQKITFGDMREMGVQGVLIYRADYHGGHSVALSFDRWPDELRLSDLELRFVCRACGRRGADIRPDFNWNKPAPALEERHWSRPYPRLPGPFILPARPAAGMHRKARTSSDKWLRRAWA